MGDGGPVRRHPAGQYAALCVRLDGTGPLGGVYLRRQRVHMGAHEAAVFSGAVEMIARIFVSLMFVPIFKFNAICFADQTAWIFACLYIVPTCLICLKKIEKNLKSAK